MAYLALYRKYRPQDFSDVVGQRAITDTLKNQLMTGRLSHAYLFTGTRGTGKTTCAKILAKAVNCENLQGGDPCNRCPSCLAIDSGSCMDVLEIDAASNNGVDNVRALRDEAIYSPAQVKKRVYIIDEVHMLSMSAFNALLKIIEEPPPHLMFILATTELHKVPATILSRCQRYSFRRILTQDIASRLGFVAYEEGIQVDPDALALLARLADGALRDGLSLLDQCVATVENHLDVDGVYKALGLAGSQKTAQLMTAVGGGDSSTALALFSQLYASGKDVGAVVSELCDLARDLLLLSTAPNTYQDMLSGICAPQELQQLAPLFGQGQLLRMTKILQETANGFARSANRKLDTELCLMELSTPALSDDMGAISARLSKLEQQMANGIPMAPQVVQAPVMAPQMEVPVAPPPPPRPVLDSLPPNFREGFLTFVKGSMEPGNIAFLDKVELELTGDTLTVFCGTVFDKNMINKVNTVKAMQQVSQDILGKPVQIKLQVRQIGGGDGGGIARFAQFGKEHSDIFQVK